MKPIKVVTPVLGDPDAPSQILVGLGALAAELAAEGVSVRDLFARSGVDASQLEDAHARISHRQRLALYRNARRLAKRSDIGLLAGARQRFGNSTAQRCSIFMRSAPLLTRPCARCSPCASNPGSHSYC